MANRPGDENVVAFPVRFFLVIHTQDPSQVLCNAWFLSDDDNGHVASRAGRPYLNPPLKLGEHNLARLHWVIALFTVVSDSLPVGRFVPWKFASRTATTDATWVACTDQVLRCLENRLPSGVGLHGQPHRLHSRFRASACHLEHALVVHVMLNEKIPVVRFSGQREVNSSRLVIGHRQQQLLKVPHGVHRQMHHQALVPQQHSGRFANRWPEGVRDAHQCILNGTSIEG